MMTKHEIEREIGFLMALGPTLPRALHQGVLDIIKTDFRLLTLVEDEARRYDDWHRATSEGMPERVR